MSGIPTSKMSKSKSQIASKIPTSGRDSGTHSRSSSVSNLTTASDIHSEIGDITSDSTEDFKIDDRVWVNGTKPGYIKFIGKTQFAPGIWTGVLLDEPVGKNDGSVAGIKYFTCEPQKGIFARPGKLTRTPGAVSNSGDSSMVGTVTPKSSSVIPSSRASVCSNVSSTSPKYPKLKVGDRITVSSLSGLKTGILKFVGETDFAKGEWAGIELDEPGGKNDGSVAGKRYFTCQMKYGLFAPMHKVSRPGMTTPCSRPGSVRGTPLLRSNSKDSLASSISNSSRASRVKLGVTSLTSSQKFKISGVGITTASKALQEALKEKEQHIEQLLKERDFDRAEFARLTGHFEEVDKKSSELEKRQKSADFDKKTLEEQLASVKRKLEDIQFQLEEEKIAKSDFEVQVEKKNSILKHIQNFVSKDSAEKYINIREILSGQEVSESGDVVASTGDSEFEKKVVELESTIKSLLNEKMEMCTQLADLQKSSNESSKNETLITNLNTMVQEKDDMITNLKNELNSNIEKVTQLIEDNKYLSEQILLKEEQAKGHADDVIKELGEKVNSLSDELKTKSSLLAEHVASVQDKDNKITHLEHSLGDQTSALTQLQNEFKNVNDALKQKEYQYEENVAAQKCLKEEIVALKSQLETDNDNKKKINLLEEEIKTKSGLLNDYLSSIEEKENLISSLQQTFDSHAASLSQLQTEKRDLNESLKQKDLELGDKSTKIKHLEEQISSLTTHNESAVAETEKKMLDLVKEIEHLTNCVQEKEDQLLKAQKELNEAQCSIKTLNETIQQLSEKVQQTDLSLSEATKDASEKIGKLQTELNLITQEKFDLKSQYEKEIGVFKTTIKVQEDELQDKIEIIAQNESQLGLLSEKLKKNEEEISALKREVGTLTEQNSEVFKEMKNSGTLLKEKDQIISDLTEQIKILTKSVGKSNVNLEQSARLLQSLQDSLNLKEEENNQLISKLQLAQQNVEMLNKDSSEHVMALQNELCKIKEESTSMKTHLEQELSKIKNEKEKLSSDLKEKDDSIVAKEEALMSMEMKLKEKESTLSDLLTQKEEFVQTISKCNTNVDEIQKMHEEKLSIALSEYQSQLSDKEQEMLALKTEVEKLLSCNNDKEKCLHEKEKTLHEKEETIKSLQIKLKYSESEISNLSTQNSDLLKNIAQFSSEFEEGQRLCNDKLSSSMSEYENKLKVKDQIIQEIQNELQKHQELLENESRKVQSKDNEIKVLKNVVNEKEAQFDELGKMVESSQTQLMLLKEQNEKNEALLSSKESFINDFKTDQERQLLLKEKSFKEETQKLEELFQYKDKEMEEKKSVISNLLNEVESKKKTIESLEKELELSRNDKKKLSDDSSNVYQELNARIADMEEKYSKLLQEKEKIAKKESETRDAKKNLEFVRDSLLQEKSVQEEIVKDREAKINALQTEVNRMQAEFVQHKQELQQKLDVSEMEIEATMELKNQLEIQHSVVEELQQELQDSDEKCKKLEVEVQVIPVITSEKDKLQAQIDEFQKSNKERSEMITKMEGKHQALEEQLKNNKNLIQQKEKELSSLKEQLQKQVSGKDSVDSTSSSFKLLEDENLALRNKITLLELDKVEQKPNTSNNIAKTELSPEEAEERESLLSQVDFLNSIIVDMKQKNEELTRQLEAQTTCWEENDVNLNETRTAIAPRLFCDICDTFDLHETCDCPKQESYVEEEVPQLRRAGSRPIEERPYCNNCEMFGHWTLDCVEPDTF